MPSKVPRTTRVQNLVDMRPVKTEMYCALVPATDVFASYSWSDPGQFKLSSRIHLVKVVGKVLEVVEHFVDMVDHHFVLSVNAHPLVIFREAVAVGCTCGSCAAGRILPIIRLFQTLAILSSLRSQQMPAI